MRQRPGEGDHVHPQPGARTPEDLSIVRDVERDGLPFLAADEGEAMLDVERETARAFAAVRPARYDLARVQVDGDRRVVPAVGVGAPAGRVDLERLRAVGHLDQAGVPELRRRLALQPEGLDDLRVGLAHPDLVQRRDPANVIGPTAELRLGQVLLRRRVDDAQRPSGAIRGEEEAPAAVRGGRALRMARSAGA